DHRVTEQVHAHVKVICDDTYFHKSWSHYPLTPPCLLAHLCPLTRPCSPTYPLSCTCVCARALSLSPPMLARVLFKLLSVIILLSRALVSPSHSVNQPTMNTGPSPSVLWFLLVVVSVNSSLVTAGCNAIERLL
ncbi:hypothetical protein V8E55_009795, partial [Tylopilus felleus]